MQTNFAHLVPALVLGVAWLSPETTPSTHRRSRPGARPSRDVPRLAVLPLTDRPPFPRFPWLPGQGSRGPRPEPSLAYELGLSCGGRTGGTNRVSGRGGGGEGLTAQHRAAPRSTAHRLVVAPSCVESFQSGFIPLYFTIPLSTRPSALHAIRPSPPLPFPRPHAERKGIHGHVLLFSSSLGSILYDRQRYFINDGRTDGWRGVAWRSPR